jgi:hypothetical protein
VRRISVLVCVGLVVSAISSPAAGQGSFSDEAVGRAIQRGAAYLWGRQNRDGSWPDATGGLQIEGKDRQIGATSLMAYALLASGAKVNDPRMVKTLKWLREQETYWNYAVSLRTQAWMEAARQDVNYKPLLFKDALLLVKAAARGPKPPGSYGYRLGDKYGRGPLNDHDPSNGQYGVLGVWAAYQLRGEVPTAYWSAVMKYWLQNQERDGGWKYRSDDKSSTGTMTAAGLATMFVCVDALLANRFTRCQRTEEILVLRRALAWFDKHFVETLRNDALCHGGHGDAYYYLFGIERVGLASGYKYFGQADWYKIGARWLLGRQGGDGAWEGKYRKEVATAYALLFLARGRKAVLFNRLEYDGDWNNRPRALANFCRWGRTAFERDVYWQIINLNAPVSEWHDAPILVITGSQAPKFSDEQLQRLRHFVWQGGMLFSIAECGGAGFRNGIREACKKLFPQHELKEVPRTHALYTLQGNAPRNLTFHMVHNGGRPFVVHTDADIPLDWQLNRPTSGRPSFDAAANVALYVTGKQLQARGVSRWPKRPPKAKGLSVKLARLKYDGNYDPEPLAWERLARRLAPDCGVNLDVAGPIAIGELKSSGAAVATLTGTSELKVSEQEKAALKDFVQGGGLLVVDATGGVSGAGRKFAESAEVLLNEMFGRRSLRTLASWAELYRLKGHEIRRVQYQKTTRRRLATHEPRLKGVFVGERIGVVFSREDVTVGLIGCSPIDCDGYMPDSAYEIARNIILYAARKKK